MTASRRLAAVVIADVVGYSALMQQDDVATVQQMRQLTSEVALPVTERFRGTVIKGTGDGWLSVFASVTDAVLSSLEVQDRLAAVQAATPASRRLALRIGVSLGEVTHDGGDVFGTGVNLAARLESIAQPGGVCISDWVHEQVHALPGLLIEDMGARSHKNLEAPVRSYMVYRRPDSQAPAVASSNPTATLGKASIAVLPFANLSGDPAQDYFADGIVDDILTALARFKSLVVIARQSSFAYKERAVDVREVGQELGVRYVLEGSVQRQAHRVRITGQLIDAITGAHVWAERFEGRTDDIFELQDQLTDRVVGTLEPQIRRAEIERSRRERPDSLDAYDLFLQALPHAYAMRSADNTKALELLDRSMDLDPTYVPAWVFASWCYEQRVTRRWPNSQPGDAGRAISLAHATLDADTGDANAIALAGFVLLMVGREFEPGLAALRDAVRLNRYDAFVLMNAGWAEVFAGSLTDAAALLQRARALSPRDPSAFYVVTGLAMTGLLNRRFEEAVELATQSAAMYHEWDATYMVLASALGHLNRHEEARRAASRLRELLPATPLDQFVRALPMRDPGHLALLEEGLHRAGLTD